MVRAMVSETQLRRRVLKWSRNSNQAPGGIRLRYDNFKIVNNNKVWPHV